jgi:putative transposase
MMSSHLTVAALEGAVSDRQPRAGLVHRSDRGLQYASPEYVAALDRHGMIASMSRPANPYDNASCESFMKTLKREEIYANKYDDLDQLRVNVEEFIEQYYNRLRLHSALGYRSPEEFEREAAVADSVDARSATIEFFENNGENRQGESPASLGKGATSPPSPDPLAC